MAKLKANKPTADVLMNSMRAMGYSFEAAIADIVDNSVSAQARNIVLRFPIDPSDCCVAVCDDGIGMNKKELLDAMKYGSQWSHHLPGSMDYCPSLLWPFAQACRQTYTEKKSG